MSSLNNKKEGCSYCLKMIQEKQKQVKCLTCGRRFHAVSSWVKSFDTRYRRKFNQHMSKLFSL